MDRRADIAALEDLLRERAWLDRLVAGLVGSTADRDDVAQRTIVHVLTAPYRVRNLRGYLASVARGFALNLRRDRERQEARQRAASSRELAIDADPSLLAERAELQRRVIDALLALDEPSRTILLLRFHGENSSAEIAARLSLPASTVRSQLRRGLERLRVRLDGDSACRDWRLVLAPSIGLRVSGTGVVAVVGGMLVKWKLAVLTAVLAVSAGVGFGLFHDDSDSAESEANSLSIMARITAPEGFQDILESSRKEVDVDASGHSDPVISDSVTPEVVRLASIRGRVVREKTLEPVPDVAIRLPRALLPTIFPRRAVESFPKPESDSPFETVEVARSASDGSFRLDDITIGMNLPFVMMPRGELSAPHALTLPEPGDRSVEFRLELVSQLRGRVADARTGSPIPGATVDVSSRRGFGESRSARFVADDRGEFELSVHEEVTRDLILVSRHDGYVTTRTVWSESSSLEIPLLPVARIEGVVRGPDGAPAVGTSLHHFASIVDSARIPSGWSWRPDCSVDPDSRRVEVDAYGRFALEAVAPWSTIRFDVSHPVFSTIERSMTTSSPEDAVTIDVTFESQIGTAVIEGVLSVNGKPGPVPYRLLINSKPGFGDGLRAGSDGRIRHEAVPAGTATIMLLIPGVPMTTRKLDVPRSGVVDASIDVEVKTSWIAGRVVRADGSPVPDIGVAIRASGRDCRVGVNTDANGSFRVLTALAPGEDAIARIHRGSLLHEVSLVGGDEALEVVLPESGVVRLKVVDRETSNPIRAPSIRIYDPLGGCRVLTGSAVRSLPEDIVELELGVGDHRLEVDRSPRFFAPIEIMVQASVEPTLRIVELPRERTGALRIEIVPEADVVMPKRSLGYLWRIAGSGARLTAIPLAATRIEQAQLLGFELPVGTIDFGVRDLARNEDVVLFPSVVIEEGGTTRLRARREP